MRRPGIAICTAMEAAAIRVHRPLKRNVRALIRRDNRLSLFFIDLQRGGRRDPEQLSMAGGPGVGRIRDRTPADTRDENAPRRSGDKDNG